MSGKLIEDAHNKVFRSGDYNYVFNKINGTFMRWGKTKDEDPDRSVYGPEILDLEISAGGDCLGNCPFCYKGNGGDHPTKNMSFEDFKTILDKIPLLLTQIAFGIMDIKTNPDFFRMMQYSRDLGIIPNFTTHGLDTTPDIAKQVSKLCGAVAVSIVDKESSFEAIKMYTDAGMKQVNIHYMLSMETYEKAFKLVDEIASDPRLSKMNAVVFLQYKGKGRGVGAFKSIATPADYSRLIQYCTDKKVRYGFDSCSAPLFFKATPDKELIKFAEPCESTLFSSYINCEGKFFPCSFSEGTPGWEEGIDALYCNDFVKDVWMNPRIVEWRDVLLASSKGCKCEHSSGCRSCPIYDISPCKGKV